MNKKILSGTIVLLSCGLLAGCGSSKSTSLSASSSESTTQTSTQKRSSTSKKSSSAKSTSSSEASQSTSSISDSSTKTSSTATPAKVDDKTAGILLLLLVEPNWMKQYIGSDFFCYSPAGENPGGSDTAGYSYITANGDPSSFVYYKVDGENVTYKMWVPSASGDVAGGHFETKTVSLTTLENDYYVTQSQKNEVDGYVHQLNRESDYLANH